MIRDRLGSWIKGFAINMGICSYVRAELWTIVKGIELAWMLVIYKLILELDFMLGVNLIT